MNNISSCRQIRDKQAAVESAWDSGLLVQGQTGIWWIIVSSLARRAIFNINALHSKIQKTSVSKVEENANTPEDPKLVSVVENGEVSLAFNERSDRYLDKT